MPTSAPPFEPQALSPEDLFSRLASAPAGLAQAQALDRLRHEGPNAIPERARESLTRRIGRHVTHRFALLLWVGAVLALAGDRFNPGQGMGLIAGALVVVVLLNGAFSFWQETRAEQAMAAFRGMLSARARALRDGAPVEVDAADLVVGDVILLAEGDRVPADARLLEARGLKVDHSVLSGESEPQLRSTAPSSAARLVSRNLVFSGTLVTTGSGRALVYATGGATEIGQVASVTQRTERVQTPIRRELAHFIQVISAIALVLGLFFFATGWVIGNPFWTNLVFAIGVIVANVPEGLLPTVTLALAIAGRKMARRNALLKTLESAETLGCTSVVCTDKTGTLTQNAMRVTRVRLGSGEPLEWETEADSEELEAALSVMTLCNNATFRSEAGNLRGFGDPTEVALLLFAEERRPGSVERLRNQSPRVHERPFESATRTMATVCQTREGLVAFLKGAPEVVLRQSKFVVRDGKQVPLSGDEQQELIGAAEEQARSGQRVLALASMPLAESRNFDATTEAGGCTFVALVGMRDPPRPEVPDAVRRSRNAGIRVIVASGDHPSTVEAIAREVGIVEGLAPVVMTGEDLAALGPAALRQLLESDEVLFARTNPLDKLRIVMALQEMGHVVAVTGDGVNDAPALKRADIGVAMGRSGTDVAREAADMVLMDDNFSTIVAAVEEGRVIYGNIRRFIGYVLTSNVPEIVPYLAFVLLGIPLPLPVLLILAIDLGTDMAPAIGLATEPAEHDVMLTPPRSRSERLLSPGLLLSSYLVFGVLETAAGFCAYATVLLSSGWHLGMALAPDDPVYRSAVTAYFAAVIVCQIGNVLIWRTTRQSVLEKGLLRNRAVLFGVLTEVLLAFIVIETEIGNRLFQTVPLPWSSWLLGVPFSILMLSLAEAMKAVRRKRAALRGT